MNSTLLKVAATREGGTVRRCHGTPHHGLYNIAQHSFGAVTLLLLLHPAPSVDLIKAVQWHDVAERWLGDMPSPAKSTNPELARVYEETEARLLYQLGLLPELQQAEQHWLKAVDLLDLWLWAREEKHLGNQNVAGMLEACENALQALQLDGRLPEQVHTFWVEAAQQDHFRLPDFWPRVEAMLPPLP